MFKYFVQNYEGIANVLFSLKLLRDSKRLENRERISDPNSGGMQVYKTFLKQNIESAMKKLL
jgi:hypothetical protein